jgi:hypothetical protein
MPFSSVAPPIRKKVDPSQNQSTRSLSPLCAARYGSGSGARELRRKHSTQPEKTAARSCTRLGFESFYQCPSQNWARVRVTIFSHHRSMGVQRLIVNGAPRRITVELTGRRVFTHLRRTNHLTKHAPAAPVQRVVMRDHESPDSSRNLARAQPHDKTLQRHTRPQHTDKYKGAQRAGGNPSDASGDLESMLLGFRRFRNSKRQK